jgi:uncharacterized protein
MGKITNPQALRELYAAPGARALAKEVKELDAHCARFIALSPFCVLSSVIADGGPDLSPRGGAPGFVMVRDSRTLVIPDRPGNNRLDSLRNLAADPRIGLLFLVPGLDETLRVYGRAEIVAGAEIGEELVSNDRAPKTALKISVERAFFQCGKALMRAQLWNAESRRDRSAMPPLGEVIRDQTGLSERVETQQEMVTRYRKEL